MGLTKRIIPCLDVKNGRVVKGVNFLNLRDVGDPTESAEIYSNAGADEVAFLDITASVEKRKTILDIVKKTAEHVFIPLTVGGGIRTIEDIRLLLASGADKVSLNTAAVENPDMVKEASEQFGNQCIVVAIDAKQQKTEVRTQKTDLLSDKKWGVFTYGGRKAVALDVIAWAKQVEVLGAGEILLTSMDRDGTKAGYDLALTRAVAEAVNIPVIASGGAGTLEHLYDALSEGKADAVLAASIFHYGEYSIQETKQYLKKRGISIRM